MTDFSVAGRKALITGGASGIGKALATRLSNEGASVTIVDIDDSAGKTVASEIGAEFQHLDVTQESEWSALAKSCPDIDILCLNAGTTTNPNADAEELSLPLANISPDHYRKIMGVNVDGVVLGTLAFLPSMIKRGSGQIIVTASLAGLLPFPNEPIYSLTKHAVVGFVRSMGPALDPYGVQMSALCPGFVDTNLLTTGIKELITAFGLPVIRAENVAEAGMRIIETKSNGSLWIVNGESPISIHVPNDPALI